MTRRDYIVKWLVYALALFPVWLLDGTVLSRYPFWGVCPMLLPLATVSVATLEGAFGGAVFGVWVGFLWATTYGTPSGLAVIGLTLVGLFAGIVTQYALSRSFLSCLICSVGALAVIGALRMLRILFLRQADFEVLLQIGAAELAVSLVWLPLVYLIFWLAYRKVGGIRLSAGR